MMLGPLADALAEHAGARRLYVCTPLGWLGACGLASYRGYYEDLAILLDEDRGQLWSPARASEEVSGAIGKRFTGWKGGEFQMARDTTVWVTLGSDRTSSLVVSGVEALESCDGVLIRTRLGWGDENKWGFGQ